MSRPALLLVALVLAAYAPAVSNGWIWDDGDYVVNNPTLTQPGGLARIWGEPGATPQYYPLVFTSFWAEYRLWGLWPGGYHAVNVLLHAGAAVLLWRLLVQFGVPGAWLGAALWAVHPVTVESVAWITERKNTLSMLLALASILAYLRFHRERERGWYALALLLFLGALWSKTVACSVPAVLLVLLWWQRRLSWQDAGCLAPWFLVGAALALVTIDVEREHVGAVGEAWVFTPSERALLAGRAVCFYAEKLVWPTELTFIYPRWSLYAHAWWPWCFPAAVVCLLVGLWLGQARFGRGPLAALLIFVGVLVPALGFFDVYPFRYSFVADHFQYHAMAAPLALAGAGLFRLGELLAPRLRLAAAGALLGTLGLLTALQTTIYRDQQTLWLDTLAKNPECWMAWGNLGVIFAQDGDLDAAIAAIGHSIAINPHQPETTYNLSRIHQQRGELNLAIPLAEKARGLKTPWPDVELLLGDLYRQQGDYVEAARHYRACLEEAPADYPHRAAVEQVLRELE